MAGLLCQRADGALELFIDGDLQFNSLDEHIYHEALALPALAVALRRMQSKLRVLIIGGGDGLVARELLKSPQVERIDLVDYDPDILNLAKSDLSTLNCGSLSDERSNIHVMDAWQFVDEALGRGELFDLVISDLTVAEDVVGGRFHSVDWYAKIARLLPPQGVLAVNAVSPQATPQAYWSIFNSILSGGLLPRPLHIHIPSFTALGYGQDWGFFLASAKAINANEIAGQLTQFHLRKYLLEEQDLQRLFVFPEELFEFQAKSLPARLGSDILIHYFNNAEELKAASGAVRDAFTLDLTNLSVPVASTGMEILPPELNSALAASLLAVSENDSAESYDVENCLREVLDLMPVMQRSQSSELIADFLENPAVFLRAIDIPGLLARLLQRAAELPAQLVAELELLREKMQEWTDDQFSFLSLGSRILTVLTLVIVVGNLLYPDAVYAKGDHAAHAGRAHDSVSGGGGVRGGGYSVNTVGGGYWNGTRRVYENPRVIHDKVINNKVIERVPAKNKSSLLQPNNISDASIIDEHGIAYPVRRYHSAESGVDAKAVYRLAADTDILANGYVARPLTDRAYLLVTPANLQVVDQGSGAAVMSLQSDPSLTQFIASEIQRQISDISNCSGLSAQTVKNLSLAYPQTANEELAAVQDEANVASIPFIQDGIEVLPNVCLTADAKYIAILREGGQAVFMDRYNWYSDSGTTELSEPYPHEFKTVVVSQLTKSMRNTVSTINMLEANRQEINAYKDVLASELKAYGESTETNVEFGSRKLSREEALRLTQANLHRTEQQLVTIEEQLQVLNADANLTSSALSNLS